LLKGKGEKIWIGKHQKLRRFGLGEDGGEVNSEYGKAER